MKTLEEIQTILTLHKDTLRKRFGVRRLSIFGSYARKEPVPQSDVDILVELEHPIGWEIVDLHDYLEKILGLKVDLVTVGAFKRKPWLYQSVKEDLINV